MERIDMSAQCPNVDDLEPCPDGGRVVRLPEQCCAECGMIMYIYLCTRRMR